MLGNDIVDFKIDEQKYHNLRFINRILSNQEQYYLKQSPSPNVFLWSLWAAKEASYKAQQRNQHQLTFSPIEFVLSESTLQKLLLHHNKQQLQGKVYFKNTTIELTLNWPNPHVVHCLALIQSNTYLWSKVDSQVACVENLCSYSQQSDAVRTLANEILQRNHIEAKIVRPPLIMTGYNKLGPPILVDSKNGQARTEIISLSHDHNHLAAALLQIG